MAGLGLECRQPESTAHTVTQLLCARLLFSRQVVSDSVTHRLQHARLPCPSLFPTVCSNSYPSSQWCYLSISSSVALFSLCLHSFPASPSFPLCRLFTSGGQSIGASGTVPDTWSILHAPCHWLLTKPLEVLLSWFYLGRTVRNRKVKWLPQTPKYGWSQDFAIGF